MNGLQRQISGFLNRQAARREPENVNKLYQETLGMHDRLAVAITRACGTMYAVYLIFLFMGGWMLWQWFLDRQAFDPYPFAFLLFLGNLLQLVLMPLIMVGQNIQSKHAELRADEHYKATMASFRDAECIMDHLVAIDRELLWQREALVRIMSGVGSIDGSDMKPHEGIHVSIRVEGSTE